MKKPTSYLLAFCLFLFFWIIPLPAAAQAGQPATLVIEGGTLIDGNGGEPVRDSLIIIRGNRIQTVSRKGQASYPVDATVLQSDGKFIVPGLWDAHCHYQWWMPELFLNHGVTSVSLVGANNWSSATREAIERGKIPGPRLFLQGPTVRGAWRPGLVPINAGRMIDTPEKAREAVRRTLPAKLASVSVMRGVSFETYKAAVDEAHKAGLPVVAQAIGPEVYGREAVLAGAAILEHAAGVSYSILKDPSKWKGWGEIEVHSLDPTPYADMDEGKASELIRLMVERNVYLEPDFIAMGRGFQKRRREYELQDYRLMNDYRLSYVPENRRLKELRTYREFDVLEPAQWERRNQGYQNMVRFMKQFADAGGKLLSGTDCSSWAVPGITLHHELDILVEEVGLTPMQAIMTSTRYPAQAWRVLDRQGTIQAGKLADVVIVNDDPLQDIRNLQKIEWVIKDGKLIDRTYHSWFDSPLKNFYQGMVVGLDWVAALKQRTLQGIRFRTGLKEVGPAWSFGQPTPGIESISPSLVTEGDPTLTLTIRGVNFTIKSLVYFDGHPVPTRLVSETELRATIEAGFIARPDTFAVIVKNLGLAQQPQWGGTTSNRAHLLVNFRY